MLRLHPRWALAGALALVAGAQLWYWSRLFTEPGLLAHSDLYEYFLPTFLARFSIWSSAEFGGLPVIADPQNGTWYPVQWLFGRVLHNWSGYVVSAYVIAATGAAAYAWTLTRSTVAAVIAGVAWAWCEGLGMLYPHLSSLHGFAWFPWLLVGIEQLVQRPGPGSVALTGGVFGMLVVGGHPQIAVYCTYLALAYAACAWFAGGRSRAAFIAIVAAFASGGAAAAVQVLPTFESASWIARDEVSFGQFAEAFAKQPHELLTFLVPQFCHEGRESPGYVGLVPLALALVALATRAREWRVRFWMVVVVVATLLGLGTLTPLPAAAYYLPLYDKFRVLARHLTLAGFGWIALAALGAAALREGRVSLKQACTNAALFLAVVAGAILAVRTMPGTFDLSCATRGLTVSGATPSVEIGLHAIVAGLVGLLVAASGVRVLRPWALAFVPVVLVADLLHTADQPVDWRGYQPPGILDARLLEPSVHATRLRDRLAPEHQRLVTLEGSATDPVLPGTLARVWGIPALGGYNPVLPGRVARLASLGANGSMDASTLVQDDVTLDLMAVRFVIVRADAVLPAVPQPPQVAGAEFEFLLGPSDCRPRGPMRLSIETPPVEATAVVFSAAMTCGDNVPSGELVGQLRVAGAGGSDTWRLEAGPATAPPAFPTDRIVVSNRGPVESENLQELRVPLTQPGSVSTLTLETAPLTSALEIHRAGLLTRDGNLVPLHWPAVALTPSRWRESGRFRTSRSTDRGSDESPPGEAEYVVFENRRARPRAWFAGTIWQVEENDQLETIRFGRRRDGTPLDLTSTALVDPGAGDAGGRGTGTVVLHEVSDGKARMTVDATSPGLAILSELHHPAWRATVDGQPASVVRANYLVLGVPVGAGRHEVELTFEPWSLLAGGAISLMACAGLLACAGYALFGRRAERGGDA